MNLKLLEKNNDNIDNNENARLLENKENVSFIKDSYLQYNRIDPNKKFENFITGSSNNLAYEASIKVSENISHYNPLYIYGGVGMGKTHLLNSIGLELKKNNINLVKPVNLNTKDKKKLLEIFKEEIYPLLTPSAIDPAHPFPFIQNKGKCVLLENARIVKKIEKNCVVLLPDNIERFIRLPGESQCYVMLETLVIKFVNLIYPDFRLIHSGLFRVIRDAEIEIDDEAADLVRYFEKSN